MINQGKVSAIGNDWSSYIQRYIKGEWRATIFHDLILADATKLKNEQGLVLLDIGCGGGFDSDSKLQASLAGVASEYIGIEPDPGISLGEYFSSEFRCLFDDAPIPPDSVDIAFAVMVLEHFAEPQMFWDKIYQILKPGGVFWGFTVDARHWFVAASLLAEKLNIKEVYLNMLHGKRGEERYENYPVYYRSNTPKQVQKYTQTYRTTDILNFHRVGQLDYYMPTKVRWLGRVLDRMVIRYGLPGSVIAVRVEK